MRRLLISLLVCCRYLRCRFCLTLFFILGDLDFAIGIVRFLPSYFVWKGPREAEARVLTFFLGPWILLLIAWLVIRIIASCHTALPHSDVSKRRRGASVLDETREIELEGITRRCSRRLSGREDSRSCVIGARPFARPFSRGSYPCRFDDCKG